MTPELWKEVIVGALSALFTSVFTGVPAILLVWWTWRRDQERLIVQKLIPFTRTAEGKLVELKDNLGPRFGIMVRNRSLFPVRVSAVAYQIDGELIQFQQPYFPIRTKRNPDPLSSVVSVADENYDPQEVFSQSSLQISCGAVDRNTLSAALLRAAEKYNDSIENMMTSDLVSALVATESGNTFTSLRFHKRLLRRFFPASIIR